MVQDRIIVVCTLVLAALYLFGTAEIPTLETVDPLGPKPFPYLLCGGLVISAIWLFIETLRPRKLAEADGEEGASASLRGHEAVIVAVIVWTGIYFTALAHIGFLLSTPVFLIALMSYFNRGKWLANGLTSVLVSAGIYFLFTRVLGVTLASGILAL